MFEPLVFFTFALFASSQVSNKILVTVIAPALLVGLRMFFGGALLQIYNSFIAGYKIPWKQVKEHLLVFLFITLATTVIPSILKAYGLKYMITSKAAFFGSLDPFITAIYASFMFKEKMNLEKIIGITLGFFGTSVLLFAGYPLDEPFKAFAEFSWPELALLGSVLVSRFGWMIVQSLLKRNLYKPSQINAFIMLIGGIISIGWAFFTGQVYINSFAHINWPFMQWWPFSNFGNTGLILTFLSYSVIMGNLFAYTLYGHLLKRHNATFVSLAGFSVPLFVAFFARILLGEPLAIQFFIACAITFFGMFIFFLGERKVLKNI